MLTPPRPATFTSTTTTPEPASRGSRPFWAGRLNLIGLGCYTTLGLAALAFLVAR